MPKLVRSFALTAIPEPAGSESFTMRVTPDKPTLNADNVQQGDVVFFVEHRLGSDTDNTPAYFTVRYLNASLEVATEQYPAPRQPASRITDTDGSEVTDTDGAELYDTDGVIGGVSSDKLEELHFTWPADKYGYASVLKVEAYEDESRAVLIAEGEFTFTRMQPVYKARGEEWNSGLVFRNGEFVLVGDKVYIWQYPIPGNSSISPDLDYSQNAQGKIFTDDKTHWHPYDEWPIIATKMLFSQFALLGGAVMAGKMNPKTGAYDYAKMFSQTGRANGNEDYTDAKYDNTEFTSFNPEKDPYDSSQTWNPKACIDWKTGNSWFYDTNINGYINASKGGKIGPFEITPLFDMHYDVQNGVDENGKPIYYHSMLVSRDAIWFQNAEGNRCAAIGNRPTPASTGITTQLALIDTAKDIGIASSANIYVKGYTDSYDGHVFHQGKTALKITAVEDYDTALDISGKINAHGRDSFSDASDFGVTRAVGAANVWDDTVGRYRGCNFCFKNGICVGLVFHD